MSLTLIRNKASFNTYNPDSLSLCMYRQYFECDCSLCNRLRKDYPSSDVKIYHGPVPPTTPIVSPETSSDEEEILSQEEDLPPFMEKESDEETPRSVIKKSRK